MVAKVVVYFLGNNDDLKAKYAENDALLDEMGNKGSEAGSKMGEGLSLGFTSKAKGLGGVFTSIGNEMSNMGLPFGNALTKMGSQMSAAEGEAGSLRISLESIGKVSWAVGIVGAIAVVGEGVKMWDSYEKSLVAVDTVARNTGANMGQFSKQLTQAQGAAAKMGFDNTDVASSMANLTMATGSTKKAFADMGLVEDLARYKNVSLASAADALDHVYGGSTRTLMTWGINIDVSSGRLHSLQTEMQAVQKANLAVANVQERFNSGLISGAQYSTALSAAQLALKDANTNYAVSAQSINKILSVLRDRTNGAAEAFSKTFAGQIQAARAELHNFGVVIGHDVVDNIEKIEVVISKVIAWFEKFKIAAVLLGAVIGGPIIVGMLFTLIETLGRIGTYLLTAGGHINTFGLKAEAAGAQVNPLKASIDTLNGNMTTMNTQLLEAKTNLAAVGKAAQGAVGPVTDLQLSAEELSNQVQAATLSTDGLTEAISTGVPAASAVAVPALDSIGTAIDGLMGPIGLVMMGLSALLLVFDEVDKAGQASAAAETPVAGLNDKFQATLGGGSYNAMGKFVPTSRANLMKGLNADIAQTLAYRNQQQGAVAGSTFYDKRAGFAGTETLTSAEYNKLPKDKRAGYDAQHRAASPASAQWNEANAEYIGEKHAASLSKTDPKEFAHDIASAINYQQTTSAGAAAAAQAKILSEEFLADSKNKDTSGKPSSSSSSPNAGTTISTTRATGNAMLQQMQAALQSGTVQSLEPYMQHGGTTGGASLGTGEAAATAALGTGNAGFNKMAIEIQHLYSVHLTSLANQIVATYNAELKYYGQLEANMTQTGINAEVQNQATQYADQTAIISQKSTMLVQNITDSVAVATAKATQTSDTITAQATLAADTLGERGLYGLNLVAQEMKVSLDKMTLGYTAAADKQSVVIARTQKAGDTAVNAAKLHQDKLQKSSDLSVGVMQKIEDMAQVGSTSLGQLKAQTGLTGAQANQALLLDKADRAYQQAQDNANKNNELAQRRLAAIQNAAKVAEAKQNALISIEQAKANTEFAGSGVHIEITGVNPTDANAVASATSWAMRTKVPK
jgi:hypothetical protein